MNNLTEEHREKLRQLLLKNKYALEAYKLDLESCSNIEHSLDTAGEAHVRQRLRRTPFRFETEEESERPI